MQAVAIQISFVLVLICLPRVLDAMMRWEGRIKRTINGIIAFTFLLNVLGMKGESVFVVNYG